MDPYMLGLSDADLFTPAEHVRGVPLTLRTVRLALSSAELRFTPRTVGAYLEGFRERARFLIAASAVGAVDYASGEIAA